MGHKIDTELSDAEREVLAEALLDVKRSMGFARGLTQLSEAEAKLYDFRLMTLHTISDKLGL